MPNTKRKGKNWRKRGREHKFDQKLFLCCLVLIPNLKFLFQRDRLKALIAEEETKLSSEEKRLQQVGILCITSNI